VRACGDVVSCVSADHLLALRWDWVICDEGHKLKNPRTQLVARLTAVPTVRRLLLTGTPVQNNLSELWALFNLVTPGLLGDARSFRDEFDKPIARGQSREASAREREHGAAMTVALQKRIAPAFLRREKSTVLTAPSSVTESEGADTANTGPTPSALGHKSDMIVWLRLTQPQRRLYAAFLGSSSVAAALNKTGSALAALTVMKKICDHPGLLSHNAAAEIARGRPLASVLAGGASLPACDDDASADGDSGGAPAGASDPAASCKTAFVLSLVGSVAAEGHRVLVFSQSRAMLDGIQAAAEAAGWRFCRIDGSVPAAERARRVAAFQSDDSISLFLLTSAVGGVGLTLTGADRVVVLDPSWNPAADAQAVDRAYRMGQTRDVAVYRLITCGTVEEKIYRKCATAAFVPRHSRCSLRPRADKFSRLGCRVPARAVLMWRVISPQVRAVSRRVCELCLTCYECRPTARPLRLRACGTRHLGNRCDADGASWSRRRGRSASHRR
jgi:SNF2 family DNA or RNA helicase